MSRPAPILRGSEMRWPVRLRRATLREDAVAGLVVGVQSVPDGLATGLLAGVNPLAGLYGYIFGTFTGAVFSSSTFMAVQATGAMAMVVADVSAVHDGQDPEAALFTLSVLTGAVMLAAGVLRFGSLVRFVSNAVMVGFLSAVGVNMVLGQLANFTGYDAAGSNRVTRALDTLVHLGRLDAATGAVGVSTIVLIVVLERKGLGAIGLVIAIVVTSAVVFIVDPESVARLGGVVDVPNALPVPRLPSPRLIVGLLVPAASLAFIGLVQGAGVSASFPNPDGRIPDASRDFVAQGAANIASGVFQGMPVGGSLSATALNSEAGARSRQALLIAGLVMAIVSVTLAEVVDEVAMAALAGLLMLIGYRTIKPAELHSVWRTGSVQKVALVTTFVLTMLIPLQYSVLVGVGVSLILYVVRQSNVVTVRRWLIGVDDQISEVDAPAEVRQGEVVVLQPYGSLFFAAASVFEEALPDVTESSRRAVVILRLRGRTDLGTTFMNVLARYAEALSSVDSKLVIVSTNERVEDQFAVNGITAALGAANVYRGDDRVGATLRRAHRDAISWIAEQV